MEIVLSLAIIGKLFLFAIIAVLLAFFILWPVEDQPTSNTQVFIWVFVNVILFCYMFNLVTFKFVI